MKFLIESLKNGQLLPYVRLLLHVSTMISIGIITGSVELIAIYYLIALLFEVLIWPV